MSSGLIYPVTPNMYDIVSEVMEKNWTPEEYREYLLAEDEYEYEALAYATAVYILNYAWECEYGVIDTDLQAIMHEINPSTHR